MAMIHNGNSQSVSKGESLYIKIRVQAANAAALVDAGSTLDAAAAERASTAYLPHEQRPMLPPELAENLLSLLPGERRLAVVCTLEIGHDGETRSSDFRLAVIRSTAKLGYGEVGDRIVITAGVPFGTPGATNTLRIAWIN